MKNFRNPYVALFLSFLMLFISCSTPSIKEVEIENIDIIKLSEVVNQHLNISEKIINVFDKEKNIDVAYLTNSPKYFKKTSELKNNFVNSKVVNAEELTLLYNQTNENIVNYLQSIDAKANYTEEEVIKHISEEINKQFDENIQLTSKSSYCGSAWRRAQSRCNRNWVISNAAVAVSGFFTLGVGTIIGAAVAGGIGLLCTSEAKSDLRSCLANQVKQKGI